ncbi:type I toxin-antitoxin system Fst family toxin [Lapidilactobacillus wuchangensis]|nr:type I toxin-antitoxin system Fst family toxin [Lapidilactobacillus wuchangensis]
MDEKLLNPVFEFVVAPLLVGVLLILFDYWLHNHHRK